MSKETIYLNGLVLHAPKARLELSRQFYQTLLDAPFKLEQHGTSPQHYSCEVEEILLELYPSSEKMLSSFALSFSTSDIAAVCQRMQEHHNKPKAEHNGGKAVTFEDPEGRNIRLNGSENQVATVVRLDEVVLHTRHPSEARLFYQQLLDTPFTEQSYGAGQVPFYSGKNNDIVLKLWPDNVYVAPSPSLLFACSDLAQVRLRMENYSKEWKQIDEREARLPDPDKRKIILYEE